MGEASGGDGVTPPAAQVLVSDCIEAMRGLNSDSVDAIVTDPPYGLEFMGREWDHGVPGVPFWVEALRVLKPGGHLLAFGGTRTYPRLACAIEDAGVEVRDCLMWLYGRGFPKSLDVSKAIDRVRDDSEEVYRVTTWVREARDAAGSGTAAIDAAVGFHGMAGLVPRRGPHLLTLRSHNVSKSFSYGSTRTSRLDCPSSVGGSFPCAGTIHYDQRQSWCHSRAGVDCQGDQR